MKAGEAHSKVFKAFQLGREVETPLFSEDILWCLNLDKGRGFLVEEKSGAEYY